MYYRQSFRVLHILFWITGLCLLSPGCGGDSAPKFLEDRAGLLDSSEREGIEQMHRKLLADVDIQLYTVILASPSSDINAEAAALFDRLSLGASTKGARGVLFLVDPNGRQVRMEVGYDLEGVYTDAFTGYVEREQMVPFFENGRVGAGIDSTTELLVGKVFGSDAPTAVDIAGTGSAAYLSGGGGARTDVDIGGKTVTTKSNGSDRRFPAGETPLETLQRYREVLRDHIKDPDLGIYTPASRRFFAEWLVTHAQQDNERRGLDRGLPVAKTIQNGDRAVIRFPVNDRQASPYFFQKATSGWMLDFATMTHVIRFNHKNQWHFLDHTHSYMFGFYDWRFDDHGFPHPE